MIQVQLFRSGSFNHPNRKYKGIFKLNFKSVDELAIDIYRKLVHRSIVLTLKKL